MTQQERRFDVFIAYARENRDVAEQLYSLLTPKCTVFLDAKNLSIGDSWHKELALAQRDSAVTVIIISSNADPVFFVREEVAAAVAAARKKSRRNLVVPLYVAAGAMSDSRIPYGVRELQGIVLGGGVSLEDAADVIRQRVRTTTAHVDEAALYGGSDLPSVWNLRTERTRHFTGREELLERLLQQVDSSGGSTQVITGLGGVGKSQLAVEFAHRNRSRFSIVWWVRASDEEQMVRDLAALAPRIGVPLGEAAESTALAVRDYLSNTSERWLLVFDDAHASDAVARWLPRSGAGQIIITSRNQGWRDLAQVVDVDVLDSETAANFLMSRTGVEDVAGSQMLAERLQGYPLALELASAHIRNTAQNFSEFAERLDAIEGGESQVAQRLGASIGAILENSLTDLYESSPDSVVFMERTCFCASEPVPLWALEGEEEPLWSSDRLGSAVDSLAEHALIRRVDESAILLHELVRLTVRNRMPPDRSARRIDEMLGILNVAFPVDPTNPENWPVAEALLPHVIAAGSFALDAGRPTGLHLLNQAAIYISSRGGASDAEALLRRVASEARSILGDDHRDTLASLGNLAGTLRRMGLVSEARELQEAAVDRQRRILGDEHSDTLTGMSNLAAILRASGELAQARDVEENVLLSRRRVLGEEHPETLTAMNNLASSFQAMGDLHAARELQERVLSIRQRTLGERHPSTLASTTNLAGTLSALGELDRARELQEVALRRYLDELGENHRETLVSMSSLARILLAQGELAEARSLYERVLSARLSDMGQEHPDSLATMNNLALVHGALGGLAAARRLHEQALEGYQRLLGPEHPSTQRSMNNLAELLRRMGDREGARHLHAQVLEVLTRSLGPDHPDTLTSMNNLATTLYECGELESAGALLERAFESRRRVLGERHPDTRATFDNLAKVRSGVVKLTE